VHAKDIMTQRKEGEAKCKKEPKDKKAACSKKVMDEYAAMLAKINKGKEDELNGCDVKNTANYKMIIEDIEDYNAKRNIIKENKSKMKPLKEGLKALNIKKKDIQGKVKTLRERIRPKEIAYKLTLKGIKKNYKDRKEKAVAVKEFDKKSAGLLAELKDLKDLRADASKMNTNAQVFKYTNGMKKLKKVSQLYAIQKYCLGNGHAV
jgi:chromosome segregation ATPase